jgi:mannosyltransferase OCH1-like enzyme
VENTDNKVIQGLWIGPELSLMEQLSIASFLQNGHEYHLYVYDEVREVPSGTVIKDGNEILPASRIFQYKHSPSYAGFANFFRYKLLLERGGWWVDVDVVCLRPFDFGEEHVFATEIFRGSEVVSSGIIKAPVGSPAMEYAWRVCENKNPELLKWGETGSKLISEAVRQFSLERSVMDTRVFCPFGYQDWHRVLEPETEVLNANSYAIHLWNEKWRESNQDKNGTYPATCVYEQLKQKYLKPAAIPLALETVSKPNWPPTVSN